MRLIITAPGLLTTLKFALTMQIDEFYDDHHYLTTEETAQEFRNLIRLAQKFGVKKSKYKELTRGCGQRYHKRFGVDFNHEWDKERKKCLRTS